MTKQEATAFAKHCAYVAVDRKEIEIYRTIVKETLISEGFSQFNQIAEEQYLAEVSRLIGNEN